MVSTKCLGVVSIFSFGLFGGLASAAGPWADRVVFGVHDGEPVYQPGVGDPLTFGPFHSSDLWNDPEAVLGEPNTMDYDDLDGWGPVPGGFAGGPMRQTSLVWSVWMYGSNDTAHLGQRPGWLDGRRKNGLGLRQGGQLVVEFDEPVVDNPDDGGAFHWGVDFVVHANAFFDGGQAISGDSDMGSVVLTGAVFNAPVEISVAQSIVGPWHRLPPAVTLIPTQPWVWDADLAMWTDQALDWTRPVDPGLTAADFVGLSAADVIDLYAGSAGGTPFDLRDAVDDSGSSAPLDWVRFIRFTDPDGNEGEVCAVADVPAGPGCNAADLAEPLGLLDLADIVAYVGAFSTGDPRADLAAPTGVFDLSDLTAFVVLFSGGCP